MKVSAVVVGIVLVALVATATAEVVREKGGLTERAVPVSS